jgi:hypothetical protein
MVNKVNPKDLPWENVSFDFRKSGLVFQWFAYARIVARKHNVAPPEPDFESTSIEELEASVQTLRDLAHLPPV